jgi:hypothetical protein
VAQESGAINALGGSSLELEEHAARPGVLAAL